MIQGIGIDIIEIDRFQRSISRFGDHLLRKLFTEYEIEYCNNHVNPAEIFTSCFAAKEAVSKALATGNTGIFSWKDVEVDFHSGGKPTLKFYHSLAERMYSNHVLFTLSNSEKNIIAIVIVESNSDQNVTTRPMILDQGSMLQYP